MIYRTSPKMPYELQLRTFYVAPTRPSMKTPPQPNAKHLKVRKKDKTRVVMKADKGNCFVVMDKKEYDEKMQVLLADPNAYNKVMKPPFKRIERELNSHLLELKRQQKLDKQTYKKLHSTDGIPPAIRGSIKHHKPGNPLRPIVTCRNTAFYNISKHLGHILSPLQNHNGYLVSNSTDFTKKTDQHHH